jgi:glycosyltransferase involved in cell wall biosynthesis
MRLCVAFGLDLEPPGGAQRLALEEAAYFAREHQVTVAAPALDESYVRGAVPEGVDVVEYGKPHKGWRGVRRLLAVFRAADPELVFSHYTEEEVYAATRLLGGVPYCPHVHGSVLWFPDEPRLAPHRDRPAYVRLVSEVPGHREFHDVPGLTTRQRVWAGVGEAVRGRALREAATVFTGSDRVARELSGLYDAPATVVRPGVAADWVERADAVEARPFPFEETVLSVSRLDRRKRLGVQIRAVERLRERGRDVGLVLGGTGPDGDRLRELVADRGLGDAVRFAGFVPDAELPAYYRGADVFACSAWMSYGLAPLEAYALGTPTALSVDTYCRELLEGQPGAAVADPEPAAWADCLAGLLEGAEPPRRGVVPTWEAFCREKEHALREWGVLE